MATHDDDPIPTLSAVAKRLGVYGAPLDRRCRRPGIAGWLAPRRIRCVRVEDLPRLEAAPAAWRTRPRPRAKAPDRRSVEVTGVRQCCHEPPSGNFPEKS